MTTHRQHSLSGLSEKQVLQSRIEHGSNGFVQKKRTSFARRLLNGLSDPIIKIMLFALLANALLLFRGQGWFETAGIALAVFLASFVSALSEYGSESAFLQLEREAARVKCRVLRDGAPAEVPIEEIVCGDIILLGAGDGIPADGMLLEGKLSVDQSALNGESREAEKQPNPEGMNVKWDLAEQDRLFRGTSVTAGEGKMLACRVGEQTSFGSMAQSLLEQPRESPLKVRLEKLARSVSRLGYVAAALIAASDLFHNIVIDNGFVPSLIVSELLNMPTMAENALHAFTLAISVIIVSVPEGLPMMITVVLSRSMLKMQRDHVMVRKLTGIETAGSLNILFTDKTGTLTRGKPEVCALTMGDGQEYLPRELPKAIAPLFYLSSTINTSSQIIEGKPVGGNATDRAMLTCAYSLKADNRQVERTWFQPFDSRKKYSAASAHYDNRTVHLVKGAPELLLPKCKHYYSKEGEMRPMNALWQVEGIFSARASKGERIICLCTANNRPSDNAIEGELTLIALAAIKDLPRAEAADAVAQIKGAGVQIVMITGDSADTAVAIAKAVGIVQSKADVVLTATELGAMNDEQVRRILPNLRVVARAMPSDKSRLVRIAQGENLVVGMTGDGINDAPALRLSDVGFAMGSGTQVAKDAGDIVIMDDNIASISRAMLYGRTIFLSIQRFIVFQLTMNMCAVGISLIGPFIGVPLPVTIVQMLWINLVMDTLGGMAFAGEAPLAQYMAHPPKRRDSPVLTGQMVTQVIGMAVYLIAICTAFLRLSFVRNAFSVGEGDFLTGFFALFVFCGIMCSFCARTPRTNIFANLSKNPSFTAIMGVVSIVQVGMIYFGGTIFRTSGLTLPELIFVLCLAFTVLPYDIGRKLLIAKLKKSSFSRPILHGKNAKNMIQ